MCFRSSRRPVHLVRHGDTGGRGPVTDGALFTAGKDQPSPPTDDHRNSRFVNVSPLDQGMHALIMSANRSNSLARSDRRFEPAMNLP